MTSRRSARARERDASDDVARLMAAGLEPIRLVGAGGSGRVHEALDRRLPAAAARPSAGRPVAVTARRVAVKVLATDDAEAKARLAREARVASRLRHPALVVAEEVLDLAGVPALVLPWVDGPSLATLLAPGPLPERDALRVAARVADALAHAHQASVVHRDVKPGNVLLPASGAVLIDLGLARDLGASTVLTASGSWVGTCDYLSPEQVLGQPVGPPSDLFSLGATLFHALTGAVPFAAASALALGRKIARERPADPRRSRPDLSRAAVDLALALLEKDPLDRPTALEAASKAGSLAST